MKDSDPSVWGPSLWNVLHITATSISTSENVSAFKSLLQSLKTLLPCASCRAHFSAYLDAHADLTDGESCMVFVNALHNAVNTRLSKPTVSLEDSKRAYAPSGCASCKAIPTTTGITNNSLHLIILVLSISLLVLFVLLHRKTPLLA